MLRKRLSQIRPALFLMGITLFWILAPVAVKQSIRSAFYEFQAPVALSASYIRELQGYWAARLKSKQDLYEAGQDLARLNASYEISALENQTLKEEIARLENLLQLPSRQNYRYEIARLVERDFNAWWQTIDIRKGRNYGIPVGAPVIFSGGVVGRVQQVHAYTSTVQLLSHHRLRLAVVVEGDNRPISFRGQGSRAFDTPVGIAEYVPTDVKIVDNTNRPRLVTSGMGGVFPAGLHVGYLINLRPGAGGMFLDGDVALDERLASLHEVAVLVPVIPATQ